MKSNAQLFAELAELNPSALLLDGFEPALIGITDHQPSRPPLAIYSKAKIFEILTEQVLCEVGDEDDDDIDEAVTSHYDYNVAGSWLGEMTPVIVDDLD
jgi:hypothetical protein